MGHDRCIIGSLRRTENKFSIVLATNYKKTPGGDGSARKYMCGPSPTGVCAQALILFEPDRLDFSGDYPSARGSPLEVVPSDGLREFSAGLFRISRRRLGCRSRDRPWPPTRVRWRLPYLGGVPYWKRWLLIISTK